MIYPSAATGIAAMEPSGQYVFCVVSKHLVGTVPAFEHIGASPARQAVVAGCALHAVVAQAGHHLVITRAGVNHIPIRVRLVRYFG